MSSTHTFLLMLTKHEVSKFEIADDSNFMDGCITVKWQRFGMVSPKSNRVVIQNLVIINRWGEEHFEKLPKSMVVDLHRNQIWALGTKVTLEKIGENGALEIDTNKTPSIIECFDYDTEYIQTKKAVRNPVDTIKDDT